VAASYGVGALGGLLYLRLLNRSVDGVGGGLGGAVGQPRLLIPVILALGYNRWAARLCCFGGPGLLHASTCVQRRVTACIVSGLGRHLSSVAPPMPRKLLWLLPDARFQGGPEAGGLTRAEGMKVRLQGRHARRLQAHNERPASRCPPPRRARRYNTMLAEETGLTLQLLPMLIGFFTYKLAVVAKQSLVLFGELAAASQAAGQAAGGGEGGAGGAENAGGSSAGGGEGADVDVTSVDRAFRKRVLNEF
jgi:hypothetical protein